MSTDLLPFYDLELSLTSIEQLGYHFLCAQRILIISHKNPDGDTIGAGCALAHALESLGKDTVLFCQDPIPSKFHFLAKAREYTTELPTTNCDLIVIVDTSSYSMTGIASWLEQRSEPIITIDHHRNPAPQGSINIIQEDACSTTALLFCLFALLNLPVCLDTATALLEGIYWDTGSFRHSNTTFHTYKIASHLRELGADVQSIVTNIFQSTPISQLQLWGNILKNIQHSPKYNIAFSVLTEEILNQCKAGKEESAGAIDYLNSIPEQLFTMLITEHASEVRASLRSQHPQIDLSQIARQFGGGGHSKAAGFTIPGRLSKEYHWSITKEN